MNSQDPDHKVYSSTKGAFNVYLMKRKMIFQGKNMLVLAVFVLFYCKRWRKYGPSRMKTTFLECLHSESQWALCAIISLNTNGSPLWSLKTRADCLAHLRKLMKCDWSEFHLHCVSTFRMTLHLPCALVVCDSPYNYKEKVCRTRSTTVSSSFFKSPVFTLSSLAPPVGQSWNCIADFTAQPLWLWPNLQEHPHTSLWSSCVHLYDGTKHEWRLFLCKTTKGQQNRPCLLVICEITCAWFCCRSQD